MRLVWLSGITALVLFTGLAVYLAPLKPGVLALQLAATPRAFGEIIHAWPPEHLHRYRLHIPVDFALLAVYATFGYSLERRTNTFKVLSPRLAGTARWSLPFAAVFDALENGLHGWLTAAPRFGVPDVYAASTACSLLKWALVLGFGCLVAVALARSET